MSDIEFIAGGCAVLNVEVSSWKYAYAPFESRDVNKKRLCEFGHGLYSGKFPDGAEYDDAFVSFYCADIIEECICRDGDFERASEALVMVYAYCRRMRLRIKSFVALWICGLYLSTDHGSELVRFSEYGISGAPFDKDVAVGELIYAFLRGERAAFREKLPKVMKLISEHDIEKSAVFAENSEICVRALDAVMPAVFEYALSENGRSMFVPDSVTVKMQAFPGLPCVSGCERMLYVTYIPFADCTELFGLVDSCVRYTDNLLRQGLGIRSKIVGFTLAPEYRKHISDTIREAIPGFLPAPLKVGRKPKEKTLKEREKKKKEPEVLYEPLDLNIDLAKAKRLEAESWKLADMLAGDYGGNDISFNVDKAYNCEESESAAGNADNCIDVGDHAECVANEDALKDSLAVHDIPDDWRELYGILSEDEKMILCLCACKADASAFARKRGGMLQGYADSVNEKASDAFGDIIVETDGRNIYFIEDYNDELTEIFRDMYDTEGL